MCDAFCNNNNKNRICVCDDAFHKVQGVGMCNARFADLKHTKQHLKLCTGSGMRLPITGSSFSAYAYTCVASENKD